jgi:hypothetical protein
MPCLCCSLSLCNKKLISVAPLYKAWFCGHSLAGIGGSVPAGVWSECWVFSGRWPCLTFVQRNPTECGVSKCDLRTSPMKRVWPTGGCRAITNIIDSVCSKLISASQKHIKFQIMRPQTGLERLPVLLMKWNTVCCGAKQHRSAKDAVTRNCCC